MRRWYHRLPGRYGIAGLGLGCALLVWLLLWFFAQPLLQQIEERTGDLVWRLGGDAREERRIIVVDIDERSLKEVGPWPWPRETQARLVDRIAAGGASQQIFDVVFSDGRDGDGVLAAAIAAHDPVMAQVFALQQGGRPSVGMLAGGLDWSTCPAPFMEAGGYLANAASLAVRHAGHITPRVSSDGVVRHQPALICFQGVAYPALGLAAMTLATGAVGVSIERGKHWLDPAWKITSPQLTNAVPLDERGDLRVSWRVDPRGFVSVAAADVLAGRVPEGLLDKAWVLLGSSAFGLNDSIATPYGGTSAGFLAHLQIITALIDGRTPYTPQRAVLAQTAVAVWAGVMLVLLARRPAAVGIGLRSRRLPLYLLPLAAGALAIFTWAAHAVLLLMADLWIGWLFPALFILLAGSSMGILEHARSRIDRDQLYAHLSSYLPAPVAAALALQPPSSAIKASTQQVSVLFADIRNFSAYCEARPPEEAAAVLHAFFSTATRVVELQGGVIEAFQGDAVIAVWNGEPQDSSLSTATMAQSHDTGRHAQAALQAAIDLQAAIRGVLPDPAPAGLEPLSLGIGVETGPAMAGSFGLASRRTHMVMGRTVTIASRLVEMTGELAHPILVGEGLAAQVGGAGLESMGTFLLEGMRVPHHIYARSLDASDLPPG